MTYCFIQVIKVRMETQNLSGPLMRAGTLQEMSH